MNNLQIFKQANNISMLWDILLDELHINSSNKMVNNIKKVFDTNINLFIIKANPNLPIMELNKLFLSQVVMAVNRLFPALKHGVESETNVRRINISNEEVSSLEPYTLEPYKIEDIQLSRKRDFETELEKKRSELDNYLSPPKPKEYDFSDKIKEQKIQSMDLLLAEKMAQRNADEEHYNMIYDENIAINKEKKVSWIDESNDNNVSLNIFSKLKKTTVEEPMNIIDSNVKPIYPIDDKQYVEQKSMSLPQVKQEEINRMKINERTINERTINERIINAEPMIPKTEIVKQLNEMNKKIDDMYELINKLTKLMENRVSDTNYENYVNQL